MHGAQRRAGRSAGALVPAGTRETPVSERLSRRARVVPLDDVHSYGHLPDAAAAVPGIERARTRSGG
jgi:hypothetical protein